MSTAPFDPCGVVILALLVGQVLCVGDWWDSWRRCWKIATNIYIAILLRQSFRQWFPFIPAGFTAVDAELAFGDEIARSHS